MIYTAEVNAYFMLTIFASSLCIFNILCPAIPLKKGEINFLVNVNQEIYIIV